ncbi:MAG: DUF2130 domain-containing protein, partial [Nanoarchaeota archaeon]|nr:DUF2130 domain-containing protein [Nanoarchaeota archaeon]
PKIKGSVTELQTGLKLRNLNTGDEIESLGGPNEEDLLISVREGHNIIGRIRIDTKNVREWNKRFVQQITNYLDQNKAEVGIIATTTMPKEAFGDTVYWDARNRIIICSINHIEPAYLLSRFAIWKMHRISLECGKKLNAIERQRDVLDKIGTFLKSHKIRVHMECILNSINESDKALQKIDQQISRGIEKLKGYNNQVVESAYRALDYENELQKVVGGDA